MCIIESSKIQRTKSKKIKTYSSYSEIILLTHQCISFQILFQNIYIHISIFTKIIYCTCTCYSLIYLVNLCFHDNISSFYMIARQYLNFLNWPQMSLKFQLFFFQTRIKYRTTHCTWLLHPLSVFQSISSSPTFVS